MTLDTTVSVDLQEAKDFVESPEFHRFILNNTVSFGTAAFILQSLMNAVEEAAKQVDNT